MEVFKAKDLSPEEPIVAAYDIESFPGDKSLCLLSEYWNGWIFDIDCFTFEYFKKLNSKGLPTTLNTNNALYTYTLPISGNFITIFNVFDMVMHISTKGGWLTEKALRGFLKAVRDIFPHYELWDGKNLDRKYTKEDLKKLIMERFAKEISKAKPYKGNF
jgi:hypothetical protein